MMSSNEDKLAIVGWRVCALTLRQYMLVPVVVIMQCLRVDMSMMLMWHASDIIEYDRRRSWLPSASLNMEYDNNRTEE